MVGTFSECDRTLELHLLVLSLAKDPEVPADGSNDWARDAANAIEKAQERCPSLAPLYRWMLARCYLALGDSNKAAVEYQRMLDGGDEGLKPLHLGADVTIQDWRFVVYERLITTHRVGDLRRAVDCAERRLREFPA